MKCERDDGPVTPRKIETCTTNNLANTNSQVWVTLGDESKCDMRNLLDQVVEPQYEQFRQMNGLRPGDKVAEYWAHAKNAYRKMLRIQNKSGVPHCGGNITVFPNSDIHYSDDCTGICQYIGDSKMPGSPANFLKVLDELVKHVKNNFPPSLLNESMTVEATARSQCAISQTFFFRSIEVIEKALGQDIPSLPAAGKWQDKVNKWDRSILN
jgi:hypothetical protein